MADLIYSAYCILCTWFTVVLFEDLHIFGRYKSSVGWIWAAETIHFYYQLLGMFFLTSEEEKTIYFKELIEIYVNSDSACIVSTLMLLLATFSDTGASNPAQLELCLYIQVVMFLNRLPQNLLLKILFCLIELIIINFPYMKGRITTDQVNISYFLMADYFIIGCFFNDLSFEYIVLKFLPSYSAYPLLLIYTVVFTSFAHCNIEALYEYNRSLLITKAFSRMKDNYLFYFYSERRIIYRHSYLILKGFFIPVVSYVVGYALFSDFYVFVNFFFVQGLAYPTAYLLSMKTDEISLKLIYLNHIALTFGVFVLNHIFDILKE